MAPSPGTLHVAAQCDTVEEWDAIAALREVWFDGQRAVPLRSGCDRGERWLRFLFDEPFRMLPITLTFEDESVAARIADLGWYTHEGALYRADLAAPGVLSLDRAYPGAGPGFAYNKQLLPADAPRATAGRPS